MGEWSPDAHREPDPEVAPPEPDLRLMADGPLAGRVHVDDRGRVRACRWPRRHVWAIVDEREQPSPLEQLGPGGSAQGAFLDYEFLARRPVIVRRVCEACGSEEIVRV